MSDFSWEDGESIEKAIDVLQKVIKGQISHEEVKEAEAGLRNIFIQKYRLTQYYKGLPDSFSKGVEVVRTEYGNFITTNKRREGYIVVSPKLINFNYWEQI